MVRAHPTYESGSKLWVKHFPEDTYLLKTGLHQVLWEKISDKIKEGVHAGHVVVFLSLSEVSPQLGVSWVDEQHEDHSQDGCDHRRRHVVHHSPGAQAAAGFGIQTSQPCKHWNILQCQISRG